MHCSIHRHDKINQTFNNVTGKPTFFFGVRTTKYSVRTTIFWKVVVLRTTTFWSDFYGPGTLVTLLLLSLSLSLGFCLQIQDSWKYRIAMNPWHVECHAECHVSMTFCWSPYFHCVCSKRNWKSYSFFGLICMGRLTLSLSVMLNVYLENPELSIKNVPVGVFHSMPNKHF